jgi:hypothetical protein
MSVMRRLQGVRVPRGMTEGHYDLVCDYLNDPLLILRKDIGWRRVAQHESMNCRTRMAELKRRVICSLTILIASDK